MFATQAMPVVCLMSGLLLRARKPALAGRRGAIYARALRGAGEDQRPAQAEQELKEIRDELGEETRRIRRAAPSGASAWP